MPPEWDLWTANMLCRGMARIPRNWDSVNVKLFFEWLCKAKPEERRKPPKLLHDISQGVQFDCAGYTLSTLLRGSIIYCYELDFVLSPKDIAASLRTCTMLSFHGCVDLPHAICHVYQASNHRTHVL